MASEGIKGLAVDNGDNRRGRDEPKVRNRKGLPDLNGLCQLGLAGGLSADGLGVGGAMLSKHQACPCLLFFPNLSALSQGGSTFAICLPR